MRDTRTGAARDRAGTGRVRPDRLRSGNPDRSPAEARHGRPARDRASTLPDRPVVGTVPGSARVSGLLLLLAGLSGAVAPFLPYLVVGGRRLGTATGPGSAAVALVVPVVAVVVGAGLARARVPRFGLAYAGVAGALSVGQLLIELYRGSTSTARPAVEVIDGQRVLTSGVEIRPGWLLGVVALVLAALAGGTALVAWGRTRMEDGGSLDPVRPSLAGAAMLLSVATVLCLALPAADLPDRVVTDPSTGMETVVRQEGPLALLERPGLALLGGLLLAGAIVLASVIAPSLRPRLAAVGGLLAIAVTVGTAGLAGLRDAVASPDLVWTVPGAGLLLAGLVYVLLTGVAWRYRRAVAAPPSSLS